MFLQNLSKSPLLILAISIVALILAVTLGVQSHAAQKQINRRLEELAVDTHVKTEELGIELDHLRRQQKQIPTNEDTTTPDEIPTSSDCIALVNGCYEQLGASSENTQPATTTTIYTNQSKGLSIRLPYNANWGTSKYVLPSYEEEYSTKDRTILEGISFGPIILGEGGLGRQMGLTFEQATSVHDIFNELSKEQIEFEPTDVKLLKINGLDAVGYINTGLCGGPMLVIQGNKFNYRLGKYCSAGEVNELVEIAKTIKLIP